MHPIFENKGLLIDGVLHLSPNEAYQASLKGAIILDVRESYECFYKICKVEKVHYLAKSEKLENFLKIERIEAVIVADSVGLHSKEIVKYLLENNFENLASLNGGIMDWERDGLPLHIDVKNTISGSCPCQLHIG